LLLFQQGDGFANPFSTNPTLSSPISPREKLTEAEQSSKYARIGLILAVVTSTSLFALLITLCVCAFVMRKMNKKNKQEKPKSTPNVQLIDMRAVSSPLTPVDENTVFSPSTPSDVYSPYSPSLEHYHIVSPILYSEETGRAYSP
jgi:hypothetical protein